MVDLFRAERDRRYVARAVEAGVDAKLDVWLGMPHGFVGSLSIGTPLGNHSWNTGAGSWSEAPN